MVCIDTVKKYHDAEGTPMSGQIIYMNLGVDLFPLVKEYLVKELGFKPHEVGIISAKMKRPKGVSQKDAKQNIQNQFLGQKFNEKTLEFDPIPDKDRIKVLIGSPSIREGMNLQRYTTVLYNLTIDWNPSDLVQLYGRLHRQGNLFAAVRVVNPLLENSMDAFIFQKLEEKTARINAIFNRDGKTNFFRTEEFSPGELKKELIRDPRSLAQMIVDEEKEQIQEEKSEFENNIKIAQDIIETINMIDRSKSWTIDKVEKYNPKAAGTERSLNTYITLSEKLMRDQKDKNGNPIEYSHPFRFVDLRAGLRKLERQRKVFLDPRGIPEDPKAIEAYIEEEKKNLDGFNERIQEAESSENIDRIAQQIEKDRAAAKYKPASIPERIAEFAKLNHLLSDKRVDDVKKVPSKTPDKKKPADLQKAKAKARARARARIRVLELETKEPAKKPAKKSAKLKFEDLPKGLENEYMTAGIDIEQKSITGGYRTYLNNLPRFYNNTWRSHKKAWTALVNAFHPEMKMYEAMGILSENGVKVRSYLSMD